MHDLLSAELVLTHGLCSTQPSCQPPPAFFNPLRPGAHRAERAASQLQSPHSGGVDVKAHADRLFQFPEADASQEAHEEAGR